jgi:hypothetical protein
MIPLSAQIDALRIIVDRANPHTLMKGSFCFRKGEAELLKERLAAALKTLEASEARR